MFREVVKRPVKLLVKGAFGGLDESPRRRVLFAEDTYRLTGCGTESEDSLDQVGAIAVVAEEVVSVECFPIPPAKADDDGVSGITISRVAPHASRRVEGQWGGAGGASVEEIHALVWPAYVSKIN